MTSLKSVTILRLVVLGVISSLIQTVHGARIIGLLLAATKGHKNAFYPIMGELAKRKHDVTLVSIYKPDRQIEGLHEIWLDDVREFFFTRMPPVFDETGPINTRELTYRLLYNSPDLCRKYLEDPQIRKLIVESSSSPDGNSKPYDLVIVNGLYMECLLPVAHHLGKNMAYLSSTELLNTIAWNLNIPFPSYLPSTYLTHNTIKMDFWDRLSNALANSAYLLFRELYVFPQIDKVVQEFLPGALGAKESEQQMELVLVNRHHVIDYNIPTLPFVQEIGGATDEPAKPLDKKLEDFVKASGKAGFIFVAFGSIVNECSPRLVKEFLEAFRRIPQRVLFKYGSPLENVPDNVLVSGWFPQNDVLGHPKVKAFVTHGGHGGLLEAVYHAVPMVGMPIFVDQPAIARRIEEMMIGVELEWKHLTADTLVDSLNKVINDTRYKESALRLQALYKDNPIPPMEKAVYWIEHIIRHGGRLHLRAEGADQMNLFQYFMLDIIGFVLFVFAFITFLFVKLVKMACCGKKNVKKQEKHNKKRN